MSANPNQHVEIFNADAMLSLSMSVPYFQRIQNMMVYFIQEHAPDEVKTAVDKIKSDSKELLPWEEHLQTLMMMIQAVEEQARKDGKLVLKPLDFPQST